MANKKENSKNLAKRMFLSISMMSFFVSAGVDNASAMEQNSIFGEVNKGRSDNKSRRNAVPVPAPSAPMPALAAAKQDKSGYRLAVPDSPTPDPKTGVGGGSKIIVDTKEKSGNDSDFFANGENPIPLILRHYGTENLKNKQFSLCKATMEKLSPYLTYMFGSIPEDIPEDISEYLNRHFLQDCYSQISEVVRYIDNIKNISDVKNNIADMHDEVLSCLDSYLLSFFKEKFECNTEYFDFFSNVQNLLYCFLNVLEWEAVDRSLFNNMADLGEMCLEASHLTGQSDASHLLWCISLLCDNGIVKQDILSENVDMPDDDLIVGKKIQSLRFMKNIINNLNDESDDNLKLCLSRAYKVFCAEMVDM